MLLNWYFYDICYKPFKESFIIIFIKNIENYSKNQLHFFFSHRIFLKIFSISQYISLIRAPITFPMNFKGGLDTLTMIGIHSPNQNLTFNLLSVFFFGHEIIFRQEHTFSPPLPSCEKLT